MTRVAPVAVVIPAHNAAPYLQFALDSVQQQTERPEQVIVVDDGSTDGTAEIAERCGATVLRQAQRGPAAARNCGLAAATAEFVAFLDADDWYALDKIERSVGHLRELDAACVATDAWMVRGDRVERRKNARRIVPTVLTMETLLRGNPVVCSTVVARRQAVVAAGGFDENPDLITTEDYDLWLRLAHKEPVAYLGEPLTFFRIPHDVNSTNARFLRGVDCILDKVAARYVGEAHFENLVRRRRAEVRIDVAWDLFRSGRRDEARAMLAEASRHVRTWKATRMWLRTLLPV